MMMPDLMPAIPELVLAIGALVLLMVGVFVGEQSSKLVTGLAIGVLALAAVLLILTTDDGVTFNGAFVMDPFARLMKILVLIGSLFAITMTEGYARAEKFDKFEFPVLVVLATLGMLMMISANDMIAVYLGLELQSLSLYVIAAINRDSTKATEAGLKYFVLGALSSGILLYGMSLVYGFTGHTGFDGISNVFAQGDAPVGLVVGLVFILAGLAFKISAVPFHMWTPDVYEGAPTPVTAFFAAAPKIAAMALFMRITFGTFEAIRFEWAQIVIFISGASMALGAFAGIGQKNIKRLMAYSSIANMGYALIGVATGSQAGAEGVILYLMIYLAMVLGAFACILSMRRKDGMVENIDDLAGAARTNPVMAFILAAIMFSMAGIPPLAGFFAKFFVFNAAIEQGMYGLAVFGVLASVVGAYYYIRIVKVMYFDEPDEGFVSIPSELRVVLGLSGLFVLGFIVFANPFIALAKTAAKTFF